VYVSQKNLDRVIDEYKRENKVLSVMDFQYFSNSHLMGASINRLKQQKDTYIKINKALGPVGINFFSRLFEPIKEDEIIPPLIAK
jgi:hypothetical protein